MAALTRCRQILHRFEFRSNRGQACERLLSLWERLGEGAKLESQIAGLTPVHPFGLALFDAKNLLQIESLRVVPVKQVFARAQESRSIIRLHARRLDGEDR